MFYENSCIPVISYDECPASFFGYRIDEIALQDAEVLSASWWKGYDLPEGAGIPSGVSYAAPAVTGNLVLRDGSLDRILIPGGYVWLPEGMAPVYCYNITDHLGSVRMVVDEAGTPLQVNHFDPFGNELDTNLASNLIGHDPVLAGTTDINPYKYGGKEWDASLSMYDFSARKYHPAIGRFTTMDPLCEKYYSVSPYAYCNNNPVNLVDPEGMDVWEIDQRGNIIQKIFDLTQDAFYLVHKNENGQYSRKTMTDSEGNIKEVGIVFAYGTISSDHVVTNKEATSFSTTTEKAGAALFKFLADNLPIEVGFIGTIDDKGFLLMQQSSNSVNVTGLANQLDKKGESIMTIIHSHPGNRIPSGFKEGDTKGDRFAARLFPTSHNRPVEHYVYQPKNQGLIQFDATRIYPGIIMWNTMYW